MKHYSIKFLHKRRRIRDSIFVQSAIHFGFVQREEQLVFAPNLLLDAHVNIAPVLLEKVCSKIGLRTKNATDANSK